MLLFFRDISNFWENYGLEFLAGLSFVFLVLYMFSRIGKKGTVSKDTHTFKLPSLLPAIITAPLRSYSKGQKFNPSGPAMATVDATVGIKKIIPRNSKGEKKTREILQKLFGEPFRKARPDFLCNEATTEIYDDSGINLELDCFSEKLKLGVEYNGIQHYKFSPFFHKRGMGDFVLQKQRDNIKKLLCEKNGINLIVVKYDIPLDKIEEYLITECRKLGYQV